MKCDMRASCHRGNLRLGAAELKKLPLIGEKFAPGMYVVEELWMDIQESLFKGERFSLGPVSSAGVDTDKYFLKALGKKELSP